MKNSGLPCMLGSVIFFNSKTLRDILFNARTDTCNFANIKRLLLELYMGWETLRKLRNGMTQDFAALIRNRIKRDDSLCKCHRKDGMGQVGTFFL